MDDVNPEQKEALEDILNYLNDREEWNASKKNYFDIVHTGYQKDLEREEIQVHAGENANIFLIKTEEGFIVDVYGQNDIIDSITVFEDDIAVEESNAPENFSDVEIEEFKEAWGQTHDEICTNLGYDKDCDELLIDEYFWIEEDQKWYNRSASLFSDREQQIARYLYEIAQNNM
jgi:hypothetical protein